MISTGRSADRRSRRRFRLPAWRGESRGQLAPEILEDRTLLALAPALTLSIAPSTVAENAGAGAATGTVTRVNYDTTQPLTVNLASSNPSQATVPSSVVIAAGQTSATFPVTAVDNGVKTLTQNLTITASALAPAGL